MDSTQIRQNLKALYASVAKDSAPSVASDYDIEGFVAKYGLPDQSKGQHLTDEFKLPNHITFSKDSIYSTDETPGGEWKKRSDGKWQYTPSDFVLKKHSMEELQQYFKEKEPGAVLNIPNKVNEPQWEAGEVGNPEDILRFFDASADAFGTDFERLSRAFPVAPLGPQIPLDDLYKDF
jgi:hypothetical protein